MKSPLVRTLKLKVRSEAYNWLASAALEVNQTFNYCNEISWRTGTRTDRKRKWLSGFDLCSLTAGAAEYFEHIGAATIQCVCVAYAKTRVLARRSKLRWRVSRGARRPLGWVPLGSGSYSKFRQSHQSPTASCAKQPCFQFTPSSRLDSKTRMAKSVLDAGWGMLKRMLQFKGEHAGRSVTIVNERNTTRACSTCGALTGPAGYVMLVAAKVGPPWKGNVSPGRAC
jgi:hypothetical protein